MISQSLLDKLQDKRGSDPAYAMAGTLASLIALFRAPTWLCISSAIVLIGMRASFLLRERPPRQLGMLEAWGWVGAAAMVTVFALGRPIWAVLPMASHLVSVIGFAIRSRHREDLEVGGQALGDILLGPIWCGTLLVAGTLAPV